MRSVDILLVYSLVEIKIDRSIVLLSSEALRFVKFLVWVDLDEEGVTRVAVQYIISNPIDRVQVIQGEIH